MCNEQFYNGSFSHILTLLSSSGDDHDDDDDDFVITIYKSKLTNLSNVEIASSSPQLKVEKIKIKLALR